MGGNLDDLLGPTPVTGKVKRGPGRPSNAQKAAEAAEALAEAQRNVQPLPHAVEFRVPVGITFIAQVMGKQPAQIQKRLEKCPVAEWKQHQGKRHPMYDFMTAMSYLIPPKGDIEDWFAQQNAASLPPFVNKMWWDSAHQRNRVMMASGDLWHTEDVMLVLGRVAMMIRQDVKMWIEDLPEKDILNDRQYGALVDATNRLVDDIRKSLVEMPGETLSMTAHIKSELDTSNRMIDDADKPADAVE